MKDLHIHTKYSDGEFDENEIVKRVIEAGIDEFAICDHDTIKGSYKVKSVVDRLNCGLKFHTGVEISSRTTELFGGINFHLLVRDFDFDDDVVLNVVREMKQKRLDKIKLMVDKVESCYGIVLPHSLIASKLNETEAFGKPHIYEILSKLGDYNRKEFYKNMSGLKSEGLKSDAINFLDKFNGHKGYITLAHPKEIMAEYDLTYNDINEIVRVLKLHGLKGLEVKHSKHTYYDYEQFSKIAKKYSLIETQGSDYHGPHIKPHVYLGVCELNDEIIK